MTSYFKKHSRVFLLFIVFIAVVLSVTISAAAQGINRILPSDLMDTIRNALGSLPFPYPLLDYVHNYLLKGQILTYEIPVTFYILAFFILNGILISALFKQFFNRALVCLGTHPILIFCTGLLAVVLIGPLLLLATVTVIGIPAIPVVCVLFLVLTFLGFTGMNAHIGNLLAGALKRNPIHWIPAVLIGAVLSGLLYMIPYAGIFALIFIGTMSIGGGLYTAFTLIPQRKQTAQNTHSRGSDSNTNDDRDSVVPPLSQEAPILQQPCTAGPTAHDAGPAPIPQENHEVIAPMWSRLCAGLIDVFMISLLYHLIFSFFPFYFKLELVALLIYFITMWHVKGTTLGNIIFNLRVKRIDNSKITVPVAVIRGLGLILSIIPFGIGFFWMRWDRDKQTWYDKFSGTIVVRTRKPTPLL